MGEANFYYFTCLKLELFLNKKRNHQIKNFLRTGNKRKTIFIQTLSDDSEQCRNRGF